MRVFFGAKAREYLRCTECNAAECFKPPLRGSPHLDKESMLAALDEKIANIINDGDKYNEEATVALQYHDEICNTASCASYVLNSSARPRNSTHRALTDTATQGASTQASSQTPLQVALPKLHVPVFSRECREWQAF
ncbi:hypothetical protein HPB50_022038 [Hyalomma asiaticum]|uniref:Uncharacterized protein n=1 Tax=Hyalomma asiaticum TaxID=266040 RepID=A0ACB7T1P7_HYAAI|nr:hypothetical protein HPB50_022038 [Hyalomma asiaticum]